MSSSPTKGENVLPPPSMGGRRRGHAHRRSGAISHHDLSSVMRPSDLASRKTGSAPATPADSDISKQLEPSLDRATSQPSLPRASIEGETSTKVSESHSPPKAQPRPRVGFSDKLEYIPRPLSTISSATSSSMSTVRPSHSLSGSISSIRSNNTSSPPSAEKRRADEIFGGDLLSGSGSPGSETVKSAAVRAPAKTPYRYSPPPPDLSDSEDEPSVPSMKNTSTRHSTSYLQPSLSADPPDTFDEDNVSDAGSQPVAVSPTLGGFEPLQIQSGGLAAINTPKTSRREKRGKSWTGLLSRKSKSYEKAGSSFEPPFTVPGVKMVADNTDALGSEELADEPNFDEDSTFVIRSPQYDVPRSAPANPTPAWGSDSSEDSEPRGVLDLDAAWDSAGAEIRSKQKESALKSGKRRLHSSGMTGGFVGAGMHYHRRAESAPVMTPVDHDLGFPRFGSNPQMADVFEEDEDADNHKTHAPKGASTKKAPGSDLKPHEVDPPTVNAELSDPSQLAKPLKEGEAESTAPKSENEACSISQLEAGRFAEPIQDLNVEIVDPVDEPRFSVITKSSDESTITPTLSNDPLRTRPVPAALDFAPPRADQFSALASMNPSPSPAKSSFDVPRLSTAQSSATERSEWSSARTGEGSNEVGYSTEDVPSLTSSASTMISHPVPFTPVVGTRAEAERSHSMSYPVPARPDTAASTSKRRSFASLSMLRLGSSSGKSKLSIETRPSDDGEGGERTKKKRHRISRLVKFWKKSKEDLNA